MDPALRAPLIASSASREPVVAYENPGWPGVSKSAGRDDLEGVGA
jgi:hypothetical protein